MGSKSTGKSLVWIVIILAIVALIGFMMYRATQIGGQAVGAVAANPQLLAAFA